MFGGKTIQYPAFSGWTTRPTGETLVPAAVHHDRLRRLLGLSLADRSAARRRSSFARETDAKPIGYGAMLLEAMVAVVSLCCVMMLAHERRRCCRAAEAELHLRPGHRQLPGGARHPGRSSASRSR